MPGLLLVDDDPALPPALTRRVPALHVDTAGSVDAALALIRTERYDVIVTDQVMSGGDGLQLPATLRHDRSNVPVILMTGLVEGTHTTVRLEHAVLVRKPFHIEEFVAEVERALGRGA